MQVNEIYRDLANIVEQQQEAVEEIGTNTEGAHARAQEGLVQVCISARACSRSLLLLLLFGGGGSFCRVADSSCFSFRQMLALLLTLDLIHVLLMLVN